MTHNGSPEAAIIIGASSYLAKAAIDWLVREAQLDKIIAVSRSRINSRDKRATLEWLQSDYTEDSIAEVAAQIKKLNVEPRYVLIFNGILHNEAIWPEKSLNDMSQQQMMTVMQANAIVPSLWISQLSKGFSRKTRCDLVVLSARIGSISDNALGGWYSYRMSKAALNMMLKTTSIELTRKSPSVRVVAFHPGTNETPLTEPFRKRIPESQLLTPSFTIKRLMEILEAIDYQGEAQFIDWQGKTIAW